MTIDKKFTLKELRLNKLTKRCSKCKRVYPATSEFFHKHKNRKGGLDPWCKQCKKKYSIERYRKIKYGISIDQLHNIIKGQNNRCPICGKVFVDLIKIKRNLNVHLAPNIDHNHKTGKVRGIICNYCNRVIDLGFENPFILINVIKYIKKHAEKKNFLF